MAETKEVKGQVHHRVLQRRLRSEYHAFTTIIHSTGRVRGTDQTSFTLHNTFSHLPLWISPKGLPGTGILEPTDKKGDSLNNTYQGVIIPSSNPDIPFLLLFEIIFSGGISDYKDAVELPMSSDSQRLNRNPSNGLFKGVSEYTFEGKPDDEDEDESNGA
ncbi:MAG: hypothetical protein M2R45_04445 [Verrucomicrobia subdivision 3 bacterium]|nr:hypothetical protein [Limisphaerales bacterium]